MSNTQDFSAQISSISSKNIDAWVGFRHTLHQNPETTWNEIETSERIANQLARIPHLEIRRNVGKYGIVATLVGAKPGPTVALRADMDALPMQELNQIPYASKKSGVMHACGHDGHMAILIGAATVLASMQKEISGKIVFIFQPAEEGGAGADAMCKDGALDGVDVIFGLHGWPELPLGKIGARVGTMLAATASIEMKIQGKGGHAALPHLAIDPILIASRVIDSLQAVNSRFTAPTDPVVVSITSIHGGTTHNVIPDSVALSGTLRTTSVATQDRCIELISTLAQGIANAHGAKIDVNITKGYPATVNHKEPTGFVASSVEKALGSESFVSIPHPTMGGEDFAYYLEKIPGCFFFLGLQEPGQSCHSLHSPHFNFNDRAIEIGVKVFCDLALNWHSRS